METAKVYKICPDCQRGFMRFIGQIFQGVYRHKCSRCRKEVNYSVQYPLTEAIEKEGEKDNAR